MLVNFFFLGFRMLMYMVMVQMFNFFLVVRYNFDKSLRVNRRDFFKRRKARRKKEETGRKKAMERWSLFFFIIKEKNKKQEKDKERKILSVQIKYFKKGSYPFLLFFGFLHASSTKDREARKAGI